MEINPNHTNSRIFYSHLLMTLGRTDEAVIMGQTALDLDPLNPMIQALFGGVLTDAGEYDRAISVFEQALSIEPDHWVALGTIDDAYVLSKPGLIIFIWKKRPDWLFQKHSMSKAFLLL